LPGKGPTGPSTERCGLKSKTPSAKRATAPRRKSAAQPQRDSQATRARILSAATKEFAAHGFSGARVERIVEDARCNMRMIYHHFGSKEALYIAVLEVVYEELRTQERDLDLDAQDPKAAMERLILFTFDHFRTHPTFVRLTSLENTNRGRFIQKSSIIQRSSSPLINAIEAALNRGAAAGVFRAGIDPLQTYVSIAALACHHINNAHTLSFAFDTDLSRPDWIEARRAHVLQILMAGLQTPLGLPA
jgi:TetR/AcrR family transcriptional regulator